MTTPVHLITGLLQQEEWDFASKDHEDIKKMNESDQRPATCKMWLSLFWLGSHWRFLIYWQTHFCLYVLCNVLCFFLSPVYKQETMYRTKWQQSAYKSDTSCRGLDPRTLHRLAMSVIHSYIYRRKSCKQSLQSVSTEQCDTDNTHSVTLTTHTVSSHLPTCPMQPALTPCEPLSPSMHRSS